MNNKEPCKKHDHSSERRDKTFPSFRDNTDTKDQAIRVTKEFCDGYLPSNLSGDLYDYNFKN